MHIYIYIRTHTHTSLSLYIYICTHVFGFQEVGVEVEGPHAQLPVRAARHLRKQKENR